MIAVAAKRQIPNTNFKQGFAEDLDFEADTFDVVIFTLSLHHVRQQKWLQQLMKPYECSDQVGSSYFSNLQQRAHSSRQKFILNACDGNERKEKISAYTAMTEHPGLKLVKEVPDETIFQFDSVEDFNNSMCPKTNLESLESFLQEHRYILRAERRINIYRSL